MKEYEFNALQKKNSATLDERIGRNFFRVRSETMIPNQEESSLLIVTETTGKEEIMDCSNKSEEKVTLV